MDPFLLKKIVSLLTNVVPAALFLLIIAALLRGELGRVAKRLIAPVAIVLLALSSPTISSMLANTLEERFPEMNAPPPDTRYIAVLTGGAHRETKRSPGVILSSNQLVRLTEAVRLWRLHPDAQLITTGANFGRITSSADAMAQMAIWFGVPDANIIRLRKPKDTRSEILEITGVVGDNAVVIVSSAFHLPRISGLAETNKLTFTLAPAEWLASDSQWWGFSAQNLAVTDLIVHEYIGMGWYYLRNLFSGFSSVIPAES